jgi:hypothetical protein
MASASAIHTELGRIKESRFAIGRELTQAKAMLFHGQFGEWLAAEFSMSWTTATRYMNLYDVLSQTEFCTLQNLQERVPATTIYELTSRRTPDFVRHELVDDLERGTLAVSHPALDILIMDRIRAARAGGDNVRCAANIPQSREINRLRHAIAAVRLLKERLTASEYNEFKWLYSRAGHDAFKRVLHARTPNYNTHGFVFDGPRDRDTAAELTDRQLGDYVLEAMSTPPEGGGGE